MTTQDELRGITKDMFKDYEDLRRSGKTNMFGASRYLGWDKKEVATVMKHYREMCERWPDIRDLKEFE